MSSSGVPPVGQDLRIWANSLRAYLARAISQLAYRSAGASASQDGLLLWDNVNGYPVVSKAGEFRQLVLADGYAFFGRAADATATASDTAEALTLDAPAMASGIARGTPSSRIVFAEGGTFLLAFAAQITSSSGSTVTFRFWPRINGADIAGSTIVANLHQNDATLVVSRSAVFTVAAGDYLEVMWAVSDHTTAYLQASPATAYAPGSPSASLSITRLRA